MDDDMKDAFGKIAYDAYCEARDWKSVRGDDLPQWEEQEDSIRLAWMKAVEAVSVAFVLEQQKGQKKSTK